MTAKITVAQYISEFISKKGVKRVFLVVGGLSMHIVDAIARQKGLKYICMHHEQACVMAAEGYARETKNFGVVCVTGGPGATNTLTGVVSAHFDSTPCMIITGQTRANVISAEGVRQFGVQGFDTLPIFKNVTKYAVRIDDSKTVRYHTEKAYYLSKAGHPGVAWIEIPLDVQATLIDPTELVGYIPEEGSHEKTEIEEKLPRLLEMLKKAKRPLLLLGNGIKLSNSEFAAILLAEKLGIPIITSRLGIDIINSDHELFIGRPGIYGERAANFATQNCDLLIVLGCRLSMSLIGYDYKEFAKQAKKIMVDIDQYELNKPSTVYFDLKVNCNVKTLLDKLVNKTTEVKNEGSQIWKKQCQHWKKEYPVVLPEYIDDKNGINTYYFTERLSTFMQENDTLVVDTSSCFHVVSQTVKIKKGQKYITTGGLSTMGYAIPAAVGVANAKKKGRTIAIAGDGSLQMNIQEFQTVVQYKLPIKFFVWNNNGYLLIRHTQNNFQEGRLVGESPRTGLSCPDTGKIAGAYGIKFLRVRKIKELDVAIKETLESNGPVICEIMTPETQQIIPRVASKRLLDGRMVSKPFDDMYPYLDKETYRKEINFVKNELEKEG